MTMKLFAVRIQADTREDQSNRYKEYPSPAVYDLVWRPDIKNRVGLQNGFHECVNFKNFNGKIQGYLPPKPGGNSDWINEDDVVCFIFLTNKSKVSQKRAVELGLYDSIIGIHVGCRLVWKGTGNERRWFERPDIPQDLQDYLDQKSFEMEGKKGLYNLHFQYECPFENSLMLENPILDASEEIFPRAEHNNHVWGIMAVREIKIKPERVISLLDQKIGRTRQKGKWQTLKRLIMNYQKKF